MDVGFRVVQTFVQQWKEKQKRMCQMLLYTVNIQLVDFEFKKIKNINGFLFIVLPLPVLGLSTLIVLLSTLFPVTTRNRANLHKDSRKTCS